MLEELGAPGLTCTLKPNMHNSWFFLTEVILLKLLRLEYLSFFALGFQNQIFYTRERGLKEHDF